MSMIEATNASAKKPDNDRGMSPSFDLESRASGDG